MYKFSAPMPYSIEDINRILDINKEVEKSQITSLYASLPSDCKLFTGFEQARNLFTEHSDWDYWKRLIDHILNKNSDFIYLLNSPRPLDMPDSERQLEKVEILLDELKNIGVKKLRIASPELMTYIGKYHKNFDILSSTSLEYKTIYEYENFIKFHPEIKQIVPSHDVNKNFKLLTALKKKYPNIEIEIMVNEGCLHGCPNRNLHEISDLSNNDRSNSAYYCTSYCSYISDNFPIQSLVIGNHIYPFEICEYENAGIKNFKLVGRDGYINNFDNYLNSYTVYLKGIDNIKNIMDFPLTYFFHHLKQNKQIKKITLSDYKRFLPKIKHFVKKGHLCASHCGVECRYCYKCAEKIQKVFEKKMKEREKMPHFVPACKI